MNSKLVTMRLPEPDLAIAQEIQRTAMLSSLSEAVRVALRFWAREHGAASKVAKGKRGAGKGVSRG